MRMLLAALAMAAPGAAAAQQASGPDARPELLKELVGCRGIADGAKRLACYDRRVSALDEAERRRDVVLVDRAQVRRARRGLFGLSLPGFKLFGDREDAPDEPEFTEIETTLKDARQSGGKWLFTLDDEARWVQTDSEELAREPRPGHKIRIRKAALGSFFANVDRQRAIRVRRVN